MSEVAATVTISRRLHHVVRAVSCRGWNAWLHRRRVICLDALHVNIDALRYDFVEFIAHIAFVLSHLQDTAHLLSAALNCLLHLL